MPGLCVNFCCSTIRLSVFNQKQSLKFHILLSLFISETKNKAVHVKDNKINSVSR